MAAEIRFYLIQNEPIEGNPAAWFKVTTQPDGQIIDIELVKSSGYPHWDKSARVAIIKAARIPPDVDGKVPSVLDIAIRPKR